MKKADIRKDILLDLYVHNDLTAKSISEKLKVSTTTVQNYLHKYDICIKGIKHFGQKPEIVFNNDQWEFFDGLMLGDGSIVVKKKQRRKGCWKLPDVYGI